MNDTPWVIKYSPKSVDEMVLSNELKTLFNNIVNTGNLNNISIFGNPGIGKSTLAKILVENLDCEYWFQPCSIDGSIDMVKSTIKDFCDIIPKGKYKIIILDEADQLSQQAQMALRNIIVESMENCRFILTANYQDKIIDALKSRCTPIKLEFSAKDILIHCNNILKTERIEYSKENLVDFYQNIIIKKYPDIRTIIEHLQLMSASGSLNPFKNDKVSIQNEVVQHIYENINDNIKILREYWISNEDKFSSDYVELSQELFELFNENGIIMGIIADYLWRMSFQLDKEIQFTGMIINIKDNLKK